MTYKTTRDPGFYALLVIFAGIFTFIGLLVYNDTKNPEKDVFLDKCTKNHAIVAEYHHGKGSLERFCIKNTRIIDHEGS